MLSPSADNQSLAPGMLVATPKLDGGPFERAVIVLVHHDNDEGTIGFIVNKVLDVDFGTIMENVDRELVEGMGADLRDQAVHFGGPVQMQQLWVLYDQNSGNSQKQGVVAPDDVNQMFDHPGEREAYPFHADWSLTASSQLIENMAADEIQRQMLPMLGYTGWGDRQLEGELEEGSWLTLDFEESFLRDVPLDQIWQETFEHLGLGSNRFFMMGDGGSA